MLLLRQLPSDGGLPRSVKPGAQTCPPLRSARDQHLNGRHGDSARGKRNPEHTSRVITTHLISGGVTARAQSKAGVLPEVDKGINPKLTQVIYEFQLQEFLETLVRTQSADEW